MICILAFPAGAGAAGKKVYGFLIPTKSSVATKNKQSNGMLGALEKAITLSGQKAGIEFKFIFADPNEIMKTGVAAFAKKHMGKDIDFALLTPILYVHLKDHGLPISPFVTYTMDKKKTDKVCLWVRKADNLKSLTDLKGKSLLENASLRGIPEADEILYENGINVPSSKYFKIIGVKQNLADSAYALIFRKTDAIVASGIESRFLISADARFKEIAPLICTKPYTNPLLVYNNKVDPALVAKLRDIWTTMHKDKDFGEVKFLFYAIKGNFTPVEDSEYNSWREYYKLALKKGWMTKADVYEK
jgi:ABC-type phosphate/phosphonate transport system substrate-binding protein